MSLTKSVIFAPLLVLVLLFGWCSKETPSEGNRSDQKKIISISRTTDPPPPPSHPTSKSWSPDISMPDPMIALGFAQILFPRNSKIVQFTSQRNIDTLTQESSYSYSMSYRGTLGTNEDRTLHYLDEPHSNTILFRDHQKWAEGWIIPPIIQMISDRDCGYGYQQGCLANGYPIQFTHQLDVKHESGQIFDIISALFNFDGIMASDPQHISPSSSTRLDQSNQF